MKLKHRRNRPGKRATHRRRSHEAPPWAPRPAPLVVRRVFDTETYLEARAAMMACGRSFRPTHALVPTHGVVR